MKPTIENLNTLTEEQYTTFRMMRANCYCWNPDAENVTFESDINEPALTFSSWENAREYIEKGKRIYLLKDDVIAMLRAQRADLKMCADNARQRMDFDVFQIYNSQCNEVSRLLDELDEVEAHYF